MIEKSKNLNNYRPHSYDEAEQFLVSAVTDYWSNRCGITPQAGRVLIVRNVA